jgi:hypothetical protein
VRYFGELPPSEDGSEFQLTGYLMKDRGLFLETGLLPEDLVDFQHGKHRRYQFWMAEQDYDYYRRHLLLHEATHCYMMIVPSPRRLPLFYLEGMAELFGTHEVAADGQVSFRIYPDDPHEEVGFGRVEMIQQAVAQGDGLSIRAAWALGPPEFVKSRETPYAWSWAACCFLDSHPRYRDRFRELATIRDGTEFESALGTAFAPDLAALEREWELFTRSISYGFDFEHAAIEIRDGQPLTVGQLKQSRIVAGRGWQSTAIAVTSGADYRVTATGEAVLDQNPKPWRTEPQGISIRYAGGKPIGRLIGIVLPAAGDAGPISEVIDIGASGTFRAPRTGTLYLRINDVWNSLAGNSGAYEVSIETRD